MALEFTAVDHHGTPKDNAYQIIPADGIALPHTTSHIYVGVAGDLNYVPAGDSATPGTNILLKGLTVGWHPVRARVIHATTTTAGNMIGFY